MQVKALTVKFFSTLNCTRVPLGQSPPIHANVNAMKSLKQFEILSIIFQGHIFFECLIDYSIY